MSQLNTNKAALKLLQINGSTLTRDANTKQNIHVILPESTSKKRRSSCPNIEVFANAESNNNPNPKRGGNGNGDRDRSLYIRRLSEMEPTPEHSDDSDDDDEDGLFDDNDNHKKDPQKRDIGDGIELMLHQLQSEAKKIEQQRYQMYVSGGRGNNSRSTPYDIVRKTRNQSKHSNRNSGGGVESMNWWDQPFKDHLRNSSRPIVRETGMDQFASEYMLTMLRDQEQKVLRKRQLIEEERTRPPKHNWHELKGQDFCNELRRHKRYHKV